MRFEEAKVMDMKETLLAGIWRALEQYFELSAEEIIIMWLAVALAVAVSIWLIRWVD